MDEAGSIWIFLLSGLDIDAMYHNIDRQVSVLLIMNKREEKITATRLPGDC